MDSLICPHLGTLDETYNRGSHVEYPSFENRCLAIADFGDDAASSVMLTDQATFCLSSGHTLCPRFQAAQAALNARRSTSTPMQEAAASTEFASNWLHTNLNELDGEINGLLEQPTFDRRLWAWIGAGLTFLLIFLCGGTFALFLGWQMVSSNLGLAETNGVVESLAPVLPIVTQQPLVVVITATSVSDGLATPLAGPVLIQPTPTYSFPPAVTPTPGGQAVVLVGESQPTIAGPLPPAPGVPEPAIATPLLDIDALVPVPPTRRPTPEFEIPTSTPLPAEPTATVTPTLGPSVVVFKPEVRQLYAGECTNVTWTVKNVREVYYEGLGVPGQGSREECLEDEAEIYTLMVILGDGSTAIYTTTVKLLLPTATPTFTPTFTPFPVFTPTWTPEPPPVTPTPIITYGVDLVVSGGSQHSCAAASRCSVSVTVSNLGNQLDNLTVHMVGTGSWSAQLCRMDGVCAAGALTIYNVGPGTAGALALLVDIPGDAGGQRMSYTLEASSGNTGGAVRSDAILIELDAQ